MRKQMFIVTLEVPSAFDCYFPRLKAEGMANIIRDGVRGKSCSFIGPVPFKVSVARVDEAASVSGKMREYTSEEFEQVSEEPAASPTIRTRSPAESRERDSDS